MKETVFNAQVAYNIADIIYTSSIAAIEDIHTAMTSDETSLEDRRDICTTSVKELEGGLKTAEIQH
ncbi:Ff.00g065810.m01.CDS01 [Fusarium sp. VM40]|nr:Ff.00g065810.m01.CDS01 [Fusarium sp. VM40]